jgi:hypothetical protein
MKFTSRDFHTLRQAADVADAQRELVELIKRRENPADSWQGEAGIIGAALAVILVVTVAALTQLRNPIRLPTTRHHHNRSCRGISQL